jgi:hypothetical protein
MAEYKAVQISGTAVNDLQGGFKKRRTRKSKGGEEDFNGTAITRVGGSNVPASAPMPFNPQPPAPVLKQPELPTVQAATVQAPLQPLQGGTRQIRVELKKKHQSKKVKLNPKREMKAKTHTKKSRKFVLGVSSLHKRMTRAKRMQKTVKAMPLDKLREQLIKANLIKKTSKAPESILRQIAEDSQLVGKKVL